MITTLQKIYDGSDLSGSTTGVMYFRLESDSTIKGLTIFADEPVGSDAVFNLSQNGSDLFGGSGRPRIVSGNESGELTGLSIDGLKGDKIVLSLVSGTVAAPITLLLETDDGIEAGGGLPVPTSESIFWTGKTNVAETSSATLTKNGGSDGSFDAGAYSRQFLEYLRYVKVSAQISDGAGIGLSNVGDAKLGTDYTNIDYGLFRSGTDLKRIQDGAVTTIAGIVMSDADTVEVEYKYNTTSDLWEVNYLHSGVVAATVEMTNIQSIICADCTIQKTGASVGNCRITRVIL